MRLRKPQSNSEVKQSSEISKNSLIVTMPLGNEFTDIFKGWSPDFVVTVTIRRGHYDSTDTFVYWKGRVSTHSLKDKILELNMESIFTSQRRPGLRARVQRNCRHALYTTPCGVNKAAREVAGIIVAINVLELTIAVAASQTNSWYTGGIIEFPDGSSRTIVYHAGTTIKVSRAVRWLDDNFTEYFTLFGGVDVSIFPGCDRTLSTCINKFNNVVNQGGFKWLPTKNPMSGSSIV